MLFQLRVDDTETARDVRHGTYMDAAAVLMRLWRIEQRRIVLESARHSKNLPDFGGEIHLGNIRDDSLHDVRRL